MILLDCQQKRREYGNRTLSIHEVAADPITQFIQWYHEIEAAGSLEPEVMVLSTINWRMEPDSRIVLLKEVDEQGFIFYTNYESQKGKQLARTPLAALNFYWPELSRQVRIQGHVEKVSPQMSAKYFASRSRESQLSVYASQQSSVINEKELDKRLAEVTREFEGKSIPCPAFWGGYRVLPTTIEFWQGRDGRLHDRIVYLLKDNAWTLEILAP